MKVCCTCKLGKPLGEFRKRLASKDGLQPKCKTCETVWHKAHYRKNKDRYIQKAQRFHQNNREKRLEQMAKWRKKNPRYASDWFKAHPGYSRSKLHAYKARRRGNGGVFSPEEWDALCELFENRCLSCGEQKPLTRDHVIPVSKGGTNTIDNLQPLCLSCNCSKGDKEIDYR